MSNSFSQSALILSHNNFQNSGQLTKWCLVFQIRKSSETCVKLKFERSYAVGKAQPVPAVLYDYYHPGNKDHTKS